MEKEGAILRKSYEFALVVIEQYDNIRLKKKEYTLSKQFVRCGTSIGANANEAQHAESRADFIHKLAIFQKECTETEYWLNLLKDSNYLDQNQFRDLTLKVNELHKMITSAIITSKNILNKR